MKLRILQIQNIAVCGVAIWATAPIFAYSVTYRIIVAMLVLLWFFLEAARSDGLVRRPTWRVLVVLAYIVIVTAVEAMFGTRGVANLMQHYIFLFFFAVYESRRRDVLSLTPVFWTMVATLPIWMYMTYDALQSNPGVARMLVRDSEEAIELSSQGVGGYGLVYLSVLVLPILVALVRLKPVELLVSAHLGKSRARFAKLALCVCIALAVALVASAGYSIALYCMAIGIFLSLALGRDASKRLLVRMLVVVAVLGSAAAYIVDLLEKLAVLLGGTLFERKVSDLLNSLKGAGAEGTLGDRVDLYLKSVESFIENPVLGSMQGGGHSAVLDQFGNYGFFIGALFLWLLYFVPLRQVVARDAGMGVSFAFLATFVLVTGLNTLAGPFGIAVFVMLPWAAAMLRRAGGVGRLHGLEGGRR